MKKRVLIIEGAVYVRYSPEPLKNVGGSSVSLFSLVTGLNRNQYIPTALFYYPSPVAEKLKEMGYRVLMPRTRLRLLRQRAIGPLFFSRETHAALSFYKIFALQILPETLKLWRVFRTERPDLVHCNMSLASDLAPVLASRLSRIPCVCHVRDFLELYWVHRISSRFVSFFICISEAIRQNYLRQGIQESKLMRIYNGVDLNDFQPGLEDLRRNDSVVITQIGRLVDWKGQRVLLKAIPRILEKYGGVRFVFVGEGPERTALEGLAADLDIGKRVVFMGPVGDVRPVLANSDIIVLPSLSPEPFGRAVIEAMAMGKPVVATDVGGPREIITPAVDGLLVKPDDPVMLAEKIGHLIGHEDVRREMGRAARKTVETRFDVRTTVRETEQIYERALGGG